MWTPRPMDCGTVANTQEIVDFGQCKTATFGVLSNPSRCLPDLLPLPSPSPRCSLSVLPRPTSRRPTRSSNHTFGARQVVAANGADFGLPPFPLSLKLEHLQHAG